MEDEEVRAAWVSVVEAEERIKLMRVLIRSGVGTSEVEFFFKRQAWRCRVGKHKDKRSQKQIKLSMNSKLRDAVADLANLKKFKVRVTRKFFDERRSEARPFIRGLEKECRKIRAELKEKHDQKVKHLVRKFNPDCQNIPSSILKYSQANIFNTNHSEDVSDLRQSASVYGDVKLDEDEIQALQMDPKFAVLDPLSPEDFEVEVELCITKQKWNRMSRAGNCEDEAEREEVEMEDAMSREVFDPEAKVFNMQKQRVTDLKHNAYVILPPAQEIDYESLLELRRQKQSQIFEDYVKTNCDEKGRQKANITKQQARGLKKLRKRIEEGELIVCQTDKSGRLCVMPMGMYVEAGNGHTAGDLEVDGEFVKKTQRKLNGHISMWIKCLNMGEDWKHQDRL